MDSNRGGGSGILAVAIVVALLGIAFGGYEALQPHGTTTTATIVGGTTTITGSGAAVTTTV
jgi:hypothetical protein